MAIKEWITNPSERERESGGGHKEYTRRFQAVSDIRNESTSTVRSHEQCPKYWEKHPQNDKAVVVSISVEQDGYLWDVIVTWSTDHGDQQTNPLNMEPDISWSTQTYEDYPDTDYEGQLIQTTAGERINVPVVKADWIASINVNVTSIPSYLKNMKTIINNGPVTIEGFSWEEGQVLMPGPRISKRDYYQGIPFRTISFELMCRDDGWLVKKPNAGYIAYFERNVTKKEGDVETIETKIVRDQILINGVRPDQPQYLDERGYYIENMTQDKRIELKFAPYRLADLRKIPGVN